MLNLIRRAFLFFAAVGLLILFSSTSSAGIVALLDSGGGGGGGNAALAWLASQGETGLFEIARDEDLDGSGFVADQGGGARAGSWDFTFGGIIGYFGVKFDGLIAIYEYMGPAGPNYSDNYDLNADVWNSTADVLAIDIIDPFDSNNVLVAAGTASENGNGRYSNPNGGNFNAGAATSNVQLYSVPEAASIAIWGLIGAMVLGLQRWKK